MAVFFAWWPNLPDEADNHLAELAVEGNAIANVTRDTRDLMRGELRFPVRSWFDRAGVEHVTGFCTPIDYLEFMREAPWFERPLTSSGVRLFEYWFSVSREEQLARFEARETDPLKQWRLSPNDRASLNKWDTYAEAKEAMFFYTDTADARWTAFKSDDKKRARPDCLQHLLWERPCLQRDENLITGPDPLLVGTTAHVIGRDDAILSKTVHPSLRAQG